MWQHRRRVKFRRIACRNQYAINATTTKEYAVIAHAKIVPMIRASSVNMVIFLNNVCLRYGDVYACACVCIVKDFCETQTVPKMKLDTSIASLFRFHDLKTVVSGTVVVVEMYRTYTVL